MMNPLVEPVAFPESADLGDALQKGLGRALLWAKQGRWTDQAILLNACLHDLRYDRQCEEARGPWLWQLMEAVGATEAFREPILDSLLSITDGLAGDQQCELAVFYGRNGDERFRLRLKEIIAQKPDPSYTALGEEELIDLDGEKGFLFAGRVHGEALSSREWEWEDGYLISKGIAKLGDDVVYTLLERDSRSSPAMKRFYDNWQRALENKTTEPPASYEERMQQFSLDAVIQAAETKTNQAGFLRGWGMNANEAGLREVLNRLLSTQDSAVIVNYLRVFSNRPLPEFNERLLALLDHEDENVRERAYAALALNKHPAIRKFALDHLNDRITESNVVKLFIRNFLPGDEARLLNALRLPEDLDERHWILGDLCKILEHNPAAQCRELAKVAYFFTPCGQCRREATELLVKREVAPAWLVEECQYDAIQRIRQLAARPTLDK